MHELAEIELLSANGLRERLAHRGAEGRSFDRALLRNQRAAEHVADDHGRHHDGLIVIIIFVLIVVVILLRLPANGLLAVAIDWSDLLIELVGPLVRFPVSATGSGFVETRDDLRLACQEGTACMFQMPGFLTPMTLACLSAIAFPIFTISFAVFSLSTSSLPSFASASFPFSFRALLLPLAFALAGAQPAQVRIFIVVIRLEFGDVLRMLVRGYLLFVRLEIVHIHVVRVLAALDPDAFIVGVTHNVRGHLLEALLAEREAHLELLLVGGRKKLLEQRDLPLLRKLRCATLLVVIDVSHQAVDGRRHVSEILALLPLQQGVHPVELESTVAWVVAARELAPAFEPAVFVLFDDQECLA